VHNVNITGTAILKIRTEILLPSISEMVYQLAACFTFCSFSTKTFSTTQKNIFDMPAAIAELIQHSIIILTHISHSKNVAITGNNINNLKKREN
jgi:hypothetical protein